jgi:hypothetical protein
VSDGAATAPARRRRLHPAARLVLLLGAVGVGLVLFRASPRDVVLVYGLGDAEVRALEIEIVRDGAVLRRAELRPGAGPAGTVRHPVRLPDGDYLLRVRVAPRAGEAWRAERPITVSESSTVVVPLAPR